MKFTSNMLDSLVSVARSHKSIFWISLASGSVVISVGGLYSFTLVAIYARYWPNSDDCSLTNDCSKPKVFGLVIFITLAMYWITEVIKNLAYITFSGFYAAWYHGSSRGVVPRDVCHHAFRRGILRCFGSICHGSLAVSINQRFVQLFYDGKDPWQPLEGRLETRRDSTTSHREHGRLPPRVPIFTMLKSRIGRMYLYMNEYAFTHLVVFGGSWRLAARVCLS